MLLILESNDEGYKYDFNRNDLSENSNLKWLKVTMTNDIITNDLKVIDDSFLRDIAEIPKYDTHEEFITYLSSNEYGLLFFLLFIIHKDNNKYGVLYFPNDNTYILRKLLLPNCLSESLRKRNMNSWKFIIISNDISIQVPIEDNEDILIFLYVDGELTKMNSSNKLKEYFREIVPKIKSNRKRKVTNKLSKTTFQLNQVITNANDSSIYNIKTVVDNNGNLKTIKNEESNKKNMNLKVKVRSDYETSLLPGIFHQEITSLKLSNSLDRLTNDIIGSNEWNEEALLLLGSIGAKFFENPNFRLEANDSTPFKFKTITLDIDSTSLKIESKHNVDMNVEMDVEEYKSLIFNHIFQNSMMMKHLLDSNSFTLNYKTFMNQLVGKSKNTYYDYHNMDFVSIPTNNIFGEVLNIFIHLKEPDMSFNEMKLIVWNVIMDTTMEFVKTSHSLSLNLQSLKDRHPNTTFSGANGCSILLISILILLSRYKVIILFETYGGKKRHCFSLTPDQIDIMNNGNNEDIIVVDDELIDISKDVMKELQSASIITKLLLDFSSIVKDKCSVDLIVGLGANIETKDILDQVGFTVTNCIRIPYNDMNPKEFFQDKRRHSKEDELCPKIFVPETYRNFQQYNIFGCIPKSMQPQTTKLDTRDNFEILH